jgi:hypothetical protein
LRQRVPAAEVAGEEWAGRDTVPVALGLDLGWAAVEWVAVEAPEAQGAARALAVAARAAEVCGNSAVACLAAEAHREDRAEVAPVRVVAVDRGAVEVLVVAGGQGPEGDRAEEVDLEAVVAAARGPAVLAGEPAAADRVKALALERV